MNKRIQKGQRCKKSTTRRRNDIETSRALRHNDGLLRHNSRMTSSFELAYISNFFTYIVNCRKLVQQKKKPRRQEKTNNENNRRQTTQL